MSRWGQYTDSASVINPEQTRTFEQSQEAAFRRLVRQNIRKGPFTKSQRDVTLAFFDHWFEHRRKGAVHPGRAKLAKKAGVSIATVKRCLGLLRDAGVLIATAHLEGRDGMATEYMVDTERLYALCAAKKIRESVIGGSNDPGQGRVKMTHRIDTSAKGFPSQNFPSQEGEEQSNVIPFPKPKGGSNV